MRIAAAFIAVIGCTMALSAVAGPAFEWNCKSTGKNSKQCSVKNTGTAPGEVCTTVVEVCKDGDHVAPLCSGWLNPGDVTSKVVPALNPKIRYFEKCMGTEFRDNVVRK